MLKLLFGDDSFRLKEHLSKLKNEFKKNNADASLLYFDMDEDIEESTFLNNLKSESLFSQKKLIIANNLIKNFQAEYQKKIIAKIEETNSSDTDIILTESEKPRKNSPLYKYVLQKKGVAEFNYLQGDSLEKWIKDYVENESSKSTTISAAAIEKLIVSTGANLYHASNELDKLISFKNKSGEIKIEDIKKIVKSGVTTTIFETVESLIEKNKPKALNLFHEQLEKGEDPFYIFSMYVYQLRTIIKIQSLVFENQITNEYDIAKKAGLHPFVVKKTTQRISGMPRDKIKILYKRLLDIDIGIKTGKKDIITSLDQFIAST